MVRFVTFVTLLFLPLTLIADDFCGQHSRGVVVPASQFPRAVEQQVTIRYFVAYTPAARDLVGGADAIEAQIVSAFEGMNQIFSDSGLSIVHEVAGTQELPIDNESTDMVTAGSELAAAFDFTAAMDAVEADTLIRVIEKQLSPAPAYAGIPLTLGQARGGGLVGMGVANLSARVLAHEVGHTLGSFHDWTESSGERFFFIAPAYAAGNHFVAADTGICYRTIMSQTLKCRVDGFTDEDSQRLDLFSGANLLYEGTPTGDAENADNVRAFAFWAPYVASARGASQIPAEEGGGEEGSNGGEEENGGTDSLSLTVRAKRKALVFKGDCLDSSNTALTGATIEIYKGKKDNSDVLVASGLCLETGKFKIKFKTKKTRGRYKALNVTTLTETAWKKGKKKR